MPATLVNNNNQRETQREGEGERGGERERDRDRETERETERERDREREKQQHVKARKGVGEKKKKNRREIRLSIFERQKVQETGRKGMNQKGSRVTTNDIQALSPVLDTSAAIFLRGTLSTDIGSRQRSDCFHSPSRSAVIARRRLPLRLVEVVEG